MLTGQPWPQPGTSCPQQVRACRWHWGEPGPRSRLWWPFRPCVDVVSLTRVHPACLPVSSSLCGGGFCGALWRAWLSPCPQPLELSTLQVSPVDRCFYMYNFLIGLIHQVPCFSCTWSVSSVSDVNSGSLLRWCFVVSGWRRSSDLLRLTEQSGYCFALRMCMVVTLVLYWFQKYCFYVNNVKSELAAMLWSVAM